MDQAIFKKLHVKDGMQYIIRNAPKEFTFPEHAIPMNTQVDYVQLFCENTAELRSMMKELELYDTTQSLIWVAYPKKTSKRYQDLYRDNLWDLVLPFGYHPVSQVSLDTTWSAIRIKVNEENTRYQRPGKP